MLDGGSTRKQFLYAGTYTKDIYVFELVNRNGSNEAWMPRGTVETVGNPSFLVVNEAGDRLYAVHELDGDVQGAVTAFAVDPVTGDLKFINSRPSGGHGPVHLTIDPAVDGVHDDHLLVANYGTGNLVVLLLRPDGSIGDLVYSLEADRPNARAHQVLFDFEHRYVLAVFLGLDEIRFYEFNRNSGDLRPVEVMRRDGQANRRLVAKVPKGSGPRHMVFGRDGRYFYVANELDSTVSVFSTRVPASNGSFKLVQQHTCLPSSGNTTDVYGPRSSYAGEIDIHPSGKYVYVTNRGHDSVVVFAVNDTDGTLSPIQYAPCGGLYPRHLTFDSVGRTAFVSNQNGDGGVQLFHIDLESGRMTPQQKLKVPKAVCVLLVPPRTQLTV